MRVGSSPPGGVPRHGCLAGSTARCQTRERPLVPPEFFTLFPKRTSVLRGCGEERLFRRSPTQNRMARGATSGMQLPSILFSPLRAVRIEDFTSLKTLHPLLVVLQLVVWFPGGEQLSGEVKQQLVTWMAARHLSATASHAPGPALSSAVCGAGKAGQPLPPRRQEDVQN